MHTGAACIIISSSRPQNSPRSTKIAKEFSQIVFSHLFSLLLAQPFYLPRPSRSKNRNINKTRETHWFSSSFQRWNCSNTEAQVWICLKPSPYSRTWKPMCGVCVARDYNAARRLNTHTLVVAKEESLSYGIDGGGGWGGGGQYSPRCLTFLTGRTFTRLRVTMVPLTFPFLLD